MTHSVITTQTGTRSIFSLRSLSQTGSAATFIVGLLVLVGWISDIPSLKSVLPSLTTMKANTALAFILSGISLWVLQKEQTSLHTRRIGQVCAAFVALAGILTLSEYVLDLDLGLDQLLFKESSGAVRTSHLGRMSPVTAVNFGLVGCALLLLETTRGILPGQYLAIGAAISSLLVLVGYAYGEESLYSVSAYTSMALHTSVTFLVLCFGILHARPARGLMSVVNGKNTGSALSRRLLPFVILAPLVGGWLQIKGHGAGLYGTGFGTALFAVTLMLIFVAVIGWTARSLSRSDEKRMWAEEALRRAHDELEVRVQERTAEIVQKTRDLEQESAHAREVEVSLRESQAHTWRIISTALDAFIGMDAAGVITEWNVQAEQMFGWPRQEAIGRLLSATIIPAQHREAHERGEE